MRAIVPRVVIIEFIPIFVTTAPLKAPKNPPMITQEIKFNHNGKCITLKKNTAKIAVIPKIEPRERSRSPTKTTKVNPRHKIAIAGILPIIE